MKDAVFAYIKKKYKVSAEYPWKRYPDYAVFRHGDNNKWFALVMEVSGDKLGLDSTDYVPVINLKADDLFFRDMLIRQVPVYDDRKMFEHLILECIKRRWMKVFNVNPHWFMTN